MIEPNEKVVANINKLSRGTMAGMWRYAPVGHDYFNTALPYFKIFEKRFLKLGGFSPDISKELDGR